MSRLEDIEKRINAPGYLWDDGLEAREDVRYLLSLIPRKPEGMCTDPLCFGDCGLPSVGRDR